MAQPNHIATSSIELPTSLLHFGTCDNNLDKYKPLFEYTWDMHDLIIKRYGVELNCCAKSAIINTKLVNTEIRIDEQELLDSVCGCTCKYDLTYKINTVNPNIYSINISETDSNNDYLVPLPTLNLKSPTSGTVYREYFRSFENLINKSPITSFFYENHNIATTRNNHHEDIELIGSWSGIGGFLINEYIKHGNKTILSYMSFDYTIEFYSNQKYKIKQFNNVTNGTWVSDEFSLTLTSDSGKIHRYIFQIINKKLLLKVGDNLILAFSH